jgi:hypothetical protein
MVKRFLQCRNFKINFVLCMRSIIILLKCCHDVGACLCACFFPACYLCQIYAINDESCCSCICGGLSAIRTKIRVERAIKVFCLIK